MLVPCGEPSFLARPHAWKYKYRKLHISLYVHLVELFDIGALNKQAYWCSKQAADIIFPLPPTPPPLFFFYLAFKMIKTEWQPGILTPNRTTNRAKITVDTIWRLCFSPVCENVHKASTLVWPIYNQRNTSLSECILLLTVGYFLYSYFIKPGFFFFYSLWKRMSHTQTPSCRSPVWCVHQLRPRVGDLQSVFHPEALFVRSLESGEVTQQSDRFQSTVCQDDLIGRIDLWLCKTERQSGPLTEAGLKVS